MRIEEIGNVYGNLTVIKEGNGCYEGSRKRRSVICKCSCGNEEEYNVRSLRKGHAKNCRTHNKKENLIGQVFGTFTVVEELESVVREYEYGVRITRIFNVICECGKEKEVNLATLRNDVRCECNPKERPPQSPVFWFDKFNKNISEFSLLRVVKVLSRESEFFRVEVECECGSIHKSSTRTILKQRTKACRKCATKEGNKKRTKTKQPYYLKLSNVHNNIKARCNSPKDKAYYMYGGRGIKLSSEWEDFQTFYKDIMELGYREGLEIDRIDNDKGYSKENCQLLTPDENKLKQKAINLTPMDIHFIRSSYFDWERDRQYFSCSDNVLNNILNHRTFINVGDLI